MKEKKMKIITKVLGSVSTNCYFIVNTSTMETIIVDPADSPAMIESEITGKDLRPQAVLLTHGHFDHITAAEQVSKTFGIPIIACDKEKSLLEDPEENLSGMFGNTVKVKADEYAEDGRILELAGFLIKVIHTPGHTKGSACYYFIGEDVLLSGDTLFHESVGRTDFPTGSMSEIVHSVKDKLLVLPDDTVVYPGHGESTSIENEKKYNPFCQE